MASSTGLDDPPVDTELLTPPLGLVALLGRSDLHPAVREALRNESRPPMECVSVNELVDAPKVLIPRKRSRPPTDPVAAAAALASGNPAGYVTSAGDGVGVSASGMQTTDVPSPNANFGATQFGPAPPVTANTAANTPSNPTNPCLKRGWLAKHRRNRPALAVVFIDRGDVEGDPNAWISVGDKLDAAKRAAEAANCKLAVVVVDDGTQIAGGGDTALSNDRASAVRARAKIDPRALLLVSLPPTPSALAKIAALAKTLCAEHYGTSATRCAARTHLDNEHASAARPAFKAGIFSEFKGDWVEALKWYKRAHAALVYAKGKIGSVADDGEKYIVQKEFAITRFATQAAYKTCALSLLLDRYAPRDAVDFFKQHAAVFKKPSPNFPKSALPEFYGRSAETHELFGVLLSSRVPWGGDVIVGGVTSNTTVTTVTRPPNYTPPPNGAPPEFLPAWYFHAAANFVERKQRALELCCDALERDSSGGTSNPDQTWMDSSQRDGPCTTQLALTPGPRDGSLVRAVDGSFVPDQIFLQCLHANATETLRELLPAKRADLLETARAHYERAFDLERVSSVSSFHDQAGNDAGNDGNGTLNKTLHPNHTNPKETTTRKQKPSHHGRLFASLTHQLGGAYLARGDAAAAERAFFAAAFVFRADNWDDLLASSLMSLKECHRRRSDTHAYLLTCLELASLGGGGTTVLGERGHGAFDPDAAAHAARAALVEVGGDAVSVKTIQVGSPTSSSTSFRSDGSYPGTGQCDCAFQCVGGFCVTRAVPGEPAKFTAGVKWSLPFEVSVASVSVEFSDTTYSRREVSTNVPEVLKPNTWHEVAIEVWPKRGHPVAVTAVCVTLDSGITFRAALGQSSWGKQSEHNENDDGGDKKTNDFETSDDFRLPDFLRFPVKLGSCSLCLAAAVPARVSLQARLAGPVLLREKCALPLTVVSTGDTLDDAELSFRVRRPENGEDENENAFSSVSGNFEVEVTRGEAGSDVALIGPTDSIQIGKIAPGCEWKGVVYVRRTSLGPPSTLVVALRGAFERENAENAANETNETAATNLTQKKPTLLETEVEIAVAVPFSCAVATTSLFRTHSLCLSPDHGEGVERTTRVFTKVKLAGSSSSRLEIINAAMAASSSSSSSPETSRPQFPIALDYGDEFTHVSLSNREHTEKGLEVVWRRLESVNSQETRTTVIPTAENATEADGEVSLEGFATPRVTKKAPPITIATDAPPFVTRGVPFPMRIRFSNTTNQGQHIKVRVTDASGFVFAGVRQRSVICAPGSEHELIFVCVALKSGETLLPNVECVVVRFGKTWKPPDVSRAIYVQP